MKVNSNIFVQASFVSLFQYLSLKLSQLKQKAEDCIRDLLLVLIFKTVLISGQSKKLWMNDTRFLRSRGYSRAYQMFRIFLNFSLACPNLSNVCFVSSRPFQFLLFFKLTLISSLFPAFSPSPGLLAVSFSRQ